MQIALFQKNKDDYISLTDMARYKNPEATGLVIHHWLRKSYTLEFIGIWEQLNNSDFNVIEFGYIKNQSGSNSLPHPNLTFNIKSGPYKLELKLESFIIGSITAATTVPTVKPITTNITGSITLEIPAIAVSNSSS